MGDTNGTPNIIIVNTTTLGNKCSCILEKNVTILTFIFLNQLMIMDLHMAMILLPIIDDRLESADLQSELVL